MTTEEIKKLIDENTVVVFGKGEKGFPRCGFTAGVQEVFDELYPEYEMVNILGSPLRDAMKDFSNWPTFPQVYVKGEFIGGYDIVMEMNEEGELKELLK